MYRAVPYRTTFRAVFVPSFNTAWTVFPDESPLGVSAPRLAWPGLFFVPSAEGVRYSICGFVDFHARCGPLTASLLKDTLLMVVVQHGVDDLQLRAPFVREGVGPEIRGEQLWATMFIRRCG